jgi:hypothetical protein
MPPSNAFRLVLVQDACQKIAEGGAEEENEKQSYYHREALSLISEEEPKAFRTIEQENSVAFQGWERAPFPLAKVQRTQRRECRKKFLLFFHSLRPLHLCESLKRVPTIFVAPGGAVAHAGPRCPAPLRPGVTTLSIYSRNLHEIMASLLPRGEPLGLEPDTKGYCANFPNLVLLAS